MSSDLVWLLTRNTSSFIVKRNGVALSREPGNLLNKHSLKFSTVADRKAVSVTASDKKINLSLKKKTVDPSKVSKSVYTVALNKNVRGSAKTVKKVLSSYRPDLTNAALARVTRLVAAAKPAKAQKPKKVRGAKKL